MMDDGRLVGREVKQHMHQVESAFHALMIMCTCGFWYPVYRARKKKIERTTNIYVA